MIAMSRGLGPLGLPVVPAGSPAVAPAPGGAPSGAFDAAFADLTQALLATAAGAGQPAPGAAKGEAMPAGEPATGSAEAGEDAANGLAAMSVPVPVATPPVPVLPLPAVAPGDTDAAATDAVSVDGSPSARPSAEAATVAAATATALSTPASPTGPFADAAMSAASARESTEETPVGLPIDPVVPEALRRGRPTASPSAEAAGQRAGGPAGSAAPPGAAGRTFPAPAVTDMSDGGDATGAAAQTAAPEAAGPAAETSMPPAPAEAPPAPGLARRAEALQRALGRRSEATHGVSHPDGLTAQVARLVDAPAAETAGSDAGTPQSGDFQQQMRRQARQGVAAVVMPAPAAQSAGAPVQVDGQAGAAHDGDTAAAPTWRAAALAARFTEPAAPAELARPSAPVAPAAAPLPAEAPLLRDVRVATIEAPVRLAEPAVADDVQTQIVKSMRLQWSGGAGEARVTLKPEYLGEVVATIKVEQGVVTATLQADTPEVRRLLETQTASLREALVEHGLKLDRVVISEPETPSGQPGDRRPRGRQPQPPPSRQRRRPRDDDGGATFELTE